MAFPAKVSEEKEEEEVGWFAGTKPQRAISLALGQANGRRAFGRPIDVIAQSRRATRQPAHARLAPPIDLPLARMSN